MEIVGLWLEHVMVIYVGPYAYNLSTYRFQKPILNGDFVLQMEKEKLWLLLKTDNIKSTANTDIIFILYCSRKLPALWCCRWASHIAGIETKRNNIHNAVLLKIKSKIKPSKNLCKPYNWCQNKTARVEYIYFIWLKLKFDKQPVYPSPMTPVSSSL